MLTTDQIRQIQRSCWWWAAN